jgi:hypothetical protein
MDGEALKEALCDPSVRQESTESARSAAVSARQDARDTVNRLDDRVQLEVAKAVGANVKLDAPGAAPKD